VASEDIFQANDLPFSMAVGDGVGVSVGVGVGVAVGVGGGSTLTEGDGFGVGVDVDWGGVVSVGAGGIVFLVGVVDLLQPEDINRTSNSVTDRKREIILLLFLKKHLFMVILQSALYRCVHHTTRVSVELLDDTVPPENQ
jgi:hypothetical protein